MAANYQTASELLQEIENKKNLLERTSQQQLAAIEVARRYANIPEENLKPEEREEKINAEKFWEESNETIEKESRELQQLETELKMKLAPTGYTESLTSNLSVRTRLKMDEAKLNEDLLKLKHQFQKDQRQLNYDLEDLETKLAASKPGKAQEKLIAEKSSLDTKLRRLEADYQMETEMAKEEAAARQKVILAEEEGEEGAIQKVIEKNQESSSRVFDWMSYRPKFDGGNEWRKQSLFSNLPKEETPKEYVPKLQSTTRPVATAQKPLPPPPDKDDLMVTLMQQQLSLMKQGNVPPSERYLPEFSGDPSQWGNFKYSFERAHQKFNFENGENLARLQRALKGKARESVEHLMANEDNVPEIWRILNLRFGRSEFVLDHLIEKVKQCRKPDLNNPVTVVDFGTTVQALVANIKSYDRPIYLYNMQLINELVEKLPGSMKGSWFKHRITTKIQDPDLLQFAKWLDIEVECAMLQVKPTFGSTATAGGKDEKKAPRARRGFGSVNAIGGEEEKPMTCPSCNYKGHGLDTCWSLKKKTLDERWRVVKAAKVCFTCLKENHTTKDCPKSQACGKDGCTRKHHRLLHYESRDDREETPKVSSPRPSRKPKQDNDAKKEEQATSSAGTISLSVSIIEGTDGPLPIVPVRVKGQDGIRVVHALLDSGATRTLITKDLAEELSLKGPSITYRYRTLSGEIVESRQSMEVNLSISGRYRNAKSFPLTKVITVDEVGLAPYSLNVDEAKKRWPYLRRYKGPSLTKVTPELVIGGDHGYLAMHMELLYSTPDQPVAMRTILGWILQGKLGATNQIGSSFYVGGTPLDDTLDKLIVESFRLNEYGMAENESLSMSRQEERALQILESTTRQRPDGRWETGLLWKSEESFPHNTYDEALSRLLKTEKRMKKDENFAKVYRMKMQEYTQKKFIRKLTAEENATGPEQSWYIPHFGVVNVNKPGKFRLVFDCAAKCDGKCLNDFLLTGPDLIRALPVILWNFRRHRIVICGDIEDMFHRIYIKEEDRRAQRFLWRDGNSEMDPEIYEMQVMLFGSKSSPASAIFVKDKNAKKFAKSHPAAVAAILKDMYIDDLLTGCDEIREACQLRSDITGINGKGGFLIKKWISSSSAVMESIPESLRLTGSKQLFGNSDKTERILGLYWDPCEDVFTFRLNFAKVKPEVIAGRRPTKREMCSLIMSLFDPLGFVGNFKIKGMILFQLTWKDGIGWDDEVSESVYADWIPWLNQMSELEKLRIPRCYSFALPGAVMQLHTFVDASGEATSAISYLRISQGAEVEVAFVASKVHVANIKKSTIPRLELCAAVVGSKLAATILKDLKMKIDKCFFWSDSVTVLSWIRSESARFKMYVANRVRKIQSLSDKDDWRWVGTAENVADDGTRLKTKADISSNSRWLRGPAFLKLEPEHWPKQEETSVAALTTDEGKELEESRTPILLPSRHYLVNLLIDHEHERNNHTGRNTVYNNMRQKYWLPDGRHAIRKSWSRCLFCRLQKAKPILPEMGKLPVFRVASSCPPFTYTGADLFGPMEATVGRHREKRWGLLFTCMVTRGVHMEIVNGLSADEAIMGISRFVDCRGLPRHIYTDNGTNFQAVAKEVLKRKKFFGVDWHFIPPASPHMGGAWESMVKLVKRVLKNLLKERHPRDQTLLTAMKAVENVVNSRPLAYISSDLTDPESITPNHFLRGVGIASGDADGQLAVTGSGDIFGDIEESKEQWGKQWEKAQIMAKLFWERWSKEVLPDLLKRNKWNATAEPIQVGDVVIMMDDQRPRNEWVKAIVIRTFPGKDGVVRVAEVMIRSFRTKTITTYKRAVAKLCPTGIRVGDLNTLPRMCPNQGAGNVENL